MLEQFQAEVLGGCRRQTNSAASSATCVGDAWDERWLELAPGADVLARAWPSIGAGGHDKQVDDPAIAAAMTEPPQLLHDFLDEH
jgi:hypothetical protein